MDNKLLELLNINAEEIASGFKKASIEGKGTPQEVSDRREKIVQDFFRSYFPFPFRITKGNIIDSFNGNSNSIDCIILNPSHPYTINENDSMSSIIFADAVDFAIEVKPDLNNSTEIERAIIQIQSVKKLRRLNNSQINCAIFSNKTYKNIETLTNSIVKIYLEKNIPYNEQFDLLLVNNNFLLMNLHPESIYKLPKRFPKGLYCLEAGSSSLALLLVYINQYPLSEMRIRESFLPHYLKEFTASQGMYCIYPY